jgi:hypothetical protein
MECRQQVKVATVNDVNGSVWTDREVDLIVADYFSMLKAELAGQALNKAEHNRALQALIRRNHASIEFKHCNISAVLEKLAMPTIRGYKPRANFQKTLIDGVERYLVLDESILTSTVSTASERLGEMPTLWVGPAPEISRESPSEPEDLRRLIRKFDPAERDERNRALGRQGEELVFLYEQQRLRFAGRTDLSRKVEWTSEIRGDGAGYDIHSFDLDGRERLIEVKTTNATPKRHSFFRKTSEHSAKKEQMPSSCFVFTPSARSRPPSSCGRLSATV